MTNSLSHVSLSQFPVVLGEGEFCSEQHLREKYNIRIFERYYINQKANYLFPIIPKIWNMPKTYETNQTRPKVGFWVKLMTPLVQTLPMDRPCVTTTIYDTPCNNTLVQHMVPLTKAFCAFRMVMLPSCLVTNAPKPELMQFLSSQMFVLLALSLQ